MRHTRDAPVRDDAEVKLPAFFLLKLWAQQQTTILSEVGGVAAHSPKSFQRGSFHYWKILYHKAEGSQGRDPHPSLMGGQRLTLNQCVL